jgi:tripartite-type tricarboxylate transporter receptor subunit TctC
VKDADTVKLIQAQAIQPVGNSPEEFTSFIKQDIAMWKDVAAQAKVEVEAK